MSTKTKPNGGFPPLVIKKETKNKKDLNIKKILSDKKISPMIELDLEKNKVEIINNL